MSIANNLAHRAATSALLGGGAWWALSLESIVRPDPEGYRNVLFLVPWLLSAAAIAGLHLRQRHRAGRLGQIGAWTTLTAMLAAAVGTLSALTDSDALLWLGFPVGALGWAAGMALLGIATIRAKVVPAWAGVALAIAEPATILVAVALSPLVPLQDDGSFSGALANGAAFLALGLALRRSADGAAPASARRAAALPA